MKYPAEELYAILCLESQCHQTSLVGEDLGTVPPEVRSSMRKHGLLRTWVLQSSLRRSSKDSLSKIPSHAIAGINTHDMFPFAGFIAGADVEARVATGQLTGQLAKKELRRRARLLSSLADYLLGLGLLSPDNHAGIVAWLATNQEWANLGAPAQVERSSDAWAAQVAAPAALLGAALTYLAQSRADLLILNLEDFWLETEPQNQPGTGSECPNWCRKVARDLHYLESLGQIASTPDQHATT